MRGYVLVLAGAEPETHSAEQNKRIFRSFSLAALTSFLIRGRGDVPRCPEFQLGEGEGGGENIIY